VQALDVIGQQMLQPGLGLGPSTSITVMWETSNTPQSRRTWVFLDLRAVMQWHVPTAKIDHLRAEGEMQVIQRRTLSHGFLLPGVAKVRTAADG
jgi:hypothetical protein